MTMRGNRPPDVCALCDRPIDLTAIGNTSLHLYVGAGMVHGGGRELIPVHYGCLVFDDWEDRMQLIPVGWSGWKPQLERFRSDVGFYINGRKQ